MRRNEDIDKVLQDSLPRASRERMESARARIYVYARSDATLSSDEDLPVSRITAVWRWVPAMAAVTALVVAAIWVGVAWRAASVYAFVEAPEGSIDRIANGASHPVRSGEKIGPNEVLRTHDAAGAVLALNDGSRVEVGVKSELQFERADDGIRIHLGQGGVIVTAAKQRTGHLYVQTKDVTASVVGTVFLVNAQQEGSRVSVIEGTVEVQHASSSTKLAPGEILATYAEMPKASLAQQVSWSGNASAHAALLQAEVAQSSRSASSVAPAAFAAVSVKTIAPGTPYRGETPLGLACHGIDGTRRSPFGNLGMANRVNIAPQGRCVGTGVLLFDLIGSAFGVPPRLVFGGDDWVRTPGGGGGIAGFEFEGVADDPSTATTDQLTQMLQTMLADRFKLKVHRETQESPGYALVIAKGGPKLKEASGDGQSPMPVINEKRQMIITGNSGMPDLAQYVMTYISAPVVDKTGLSGTYEYQFPLPLFRSGQRGGATGAPPSPQDMVAEFSNTLEEHLGLKLEARRSVSVETLVIDHVEKPSAN